MSPALNTSKNGSKPATNGAAKRGRKEGQKVASLDSRAFFSLNSVNFESHVKDFADIKPGDFFSHNAWRTALVQDIIAQMRTDGIF